MYKDKKPNLFDLINNDEKYLQAEVQQLIFSGKEQSKIQEIKGIIDESTRPLFDFMEKSVKPSLVELLIKRKEWICIDDKK